MKADSRVESQGLGVRWTQIYSTRQPRERPFPRRARRMGVERAGQPRAPRPHCDRYLVDVKKAGLPSSEPAELLTVICRELREAEEGGGRLVRVAGNPESGCQVP